MDEGTQYFTDLLEGYDNNSYIEPYNAKKTEEFTVKKKVRELSVELTNSISDFVITMV